MQKIIDSSAAKGTYFAIASYRGEKSNEITFNLVTEATSEQSKIPPWVKNNAEWYGNEQLDELDFILVIEYLIENGLIKIPYLPEQTKQETEIPDWIRISAKWWADDQISDDEFINGIQYLIKNGFMKIQF